MNEERIPCPHCTQKRLLVEQRRDGKFYRSVHGPDSNGAVLCRGCKIPLRGQYP